MKRFEMILHSFAGMVLAGNGAAIALTSGPTMPEYTQFEQVEMTDMVNLSTGSFTWSLPVMNVPGPALGFPITLSYHSNPGQKAEASWVGLGWNIQAGAITRQVNKIPDDFKNVPIYEEIKSGNIHGWSASISYNGVTVGYSYHSLKGHGGTFGYNLLENMNSPVSLDATVGWGSQYRSTGISMSIGYGLSKSGLGPNGMNSVGVGAGLSVGSNMNGDLSVGAGVGASVGQVGSEKPTPTSGPFNTSASLANVGVSLSQSGGLSGGISGLVSANPFQTSGDRKMLSGGISIIIPVYGYWTVGFSHWNTWIEGYGEDRYFGFLHGDALGMGCSGPISNQVNCMNSTSSGPKNRHEFLAAERGNNLFWYRPKLMRTSEDNYVVTAEGISGTFSPHRKEDGDYSNSLRSTSKLNCNWIVNCEREEKNRIYELDIQRDRLNRDGRLDDVYWRFNEDGGGAEYTIPVYDLSERDNTAFVSVQSKWIKALYSTTGKLTGFEITNSSGARYMFDFPLQNVWESKFGHHESDVNTVTKQEFGSSYAYAWLLTSIRSVDYIDRTGNGVSEDDFGGWVKVNYGSGFGDDNFKPVQYWVTPYFDSTHQYFDNSLLNPLPRAAVTGPDGHSNITAVFDGNVRISSGRSRAEGLKEIAYIHSVETPTHKAIFKTASRRDNAPFKMAHGFDIHSTPQYWSGTIVSGNAPENNSRISGTVRILAGAQLVNGIPGLGVQSGDVVNLEIHFKYLSPFEDPLDPSCGSNYYAQDTLYIGNVQVGSTVPFAADPYPGRCGGDPSFTKIVVASKVLGTVNQSRRLTSIELFEKSALREAGANASTVKPISTVEFKQDYSLCPGTPNSEDDGGKHGKLTLNELILGGDGSEESKLPPYKFHYGANHPFQVHDYLDWVPWEIGQWDRWGNRCRNCDDGFHEPELTTNSGSAWNLNRIITPSGAEMSVNYSPKIYNYVGTEPLARSLGNDQYEILIGSGGPEMLSEHHKINASGNREYWWHYQVPLANLRKKFQARGWVVDSYRFVMNTDVEWSHASFAKTNGECAPNYSNSDPWPDDWFNLSSSACPDARLTGCEPENSTEEEVFKGVDITIPASLTGAAPPAFAAGFRPGLIKLNGSRIPKPIERNKINGDFKLYAIVFAMGASSPMEERSDGSVVSSIKLREPYSNTIQLTSYEYANGVTPSLPASYSDYSDDRESMGRGFEFYRGSPGVLYSNVTATVNKKYKTRYHFLTSKDLPVKYQDFNTRRVGIISLTNVIDMSSLWGAMWKKEELGSNGQPVKTTTTSWAANFDAIPAGVNVLESLPSTEILSPYPKAENVPYVKAWTRGGGETQYRPYFGLHQTIASHRYFSDGGCYVGDDCQINISTAQVVNKRFLPTSIKMETVQEGLKAVTHSYFHDFRSGEALKTRKENSDGSVVVTEKIPAYYQYPPMKDANAITQDYSVSNYLYPPGTRSDFLVGESASRGISSSLTIWRPYDDKASRQNLIHKDLIRGFRKFQSYVWKANPGETSTTLIIPDDICELYIHDAHKYYCPDVMAAEGNSWTLAEQVNRYDVFSHATDVMDARGVNQTSLYGHDNTQVVAFLQNTPMPAPNYSRTLQAFYESFEGNSEFKAKLTSWTSQYQRTAVTGVAKSGKYALDVKANGETGSMACFDLGVLAPNREYEASAWYYDATPGDFAIGHLGTRPGIFIGKDDGCASEYFPNGGYGEGVVTGGGGGSGEPATGSRKWKRISATIRPTQCPDSTNLDPSILCLYASKGQTARSVLYDEVRVKPGGSRMSSYTYEFGRMASSVDTRVSSRALAA